MNQNNELQSELLTYFEGTNQSLTDSGFKASIYRDYISGKTIVAFSGTNMAQISDWVTNVAQGTGFSTDQYKAAAQIGEAFKNLGNKTIFTDHSLGGGLASMAAVSTDGAVKAVTFNAAGLHPFSGWDHWDAYMNSESFIKAYYVDWDILTNLQAVTPGMPESCGTGVLLDSRYDTTMATYSAVAITSFLSGGGVLY